MAGNLAELVKFLIHTVGNDVTLSKCIRRFRQHMLPDKFIQILEYPDSPGKLGSLTAQLGTDLLDGLHLLKATLELDDLPWGNLSCCGT